ncbi:MAG: tetratricopeptide repeat protein [Planctomycetota bacterium]
MNSVDRPSFGIWIALTILGLSTGCRALIPGGNPFAQVDELSESQVASLDPSQASPLGQDGGVVQTSAESPTSVDQSGELIASVVDDESSLDAVQKGLQSAGRFLAGREQEDSNDAKRLYLEGDAKFKEASTLDDRARRSAFAKAAKLFRRAADAAPGSALEQDALFMQGESLFFADQLRAASEAYTSLQEKHPRNRHTDRIAQRQFSMTRYWIEAKQATPAWELVNLFDSSRPRVDADGHAIRVLDQIRYDDPTGRLADDATMAAAAEYLRQKRYEEADEFLTDLRETFGDSEHQFMAHLLGIRAKLEMYAGPRYSELVLDEASKLIRQTRNRFPDKLSDPEYGELVARAAKEIDFHQAERMISRARYREKRGENRAAISRYQQLLQDHPNTPQAEEAREKLESLGSLPAVPTPRMAWLTTVFPDSRAKPPLKFKGEVSDKSNDVNNSSTILR